MKQMLYPLGETDNDQCKNLNELKHTCVNAILALLDDVDEIRTSTEFKHLQAMYQLAHLHEFELLNVI